MARNIRNIFISILLLISYTVETNAQTPDKIRILETELQNSQSSGDKNQEAATCNKLAYLYWDAKELEKAIHYFKLSLEINKSLQNNNAIREINNNIALIYAENNQHKTAIDYFQYVLDSYKKSNNKSGIISSTINLAVSLQATNKYSEAVNLLEKALAIAKELNDEKVMMSIYGMLAECSEKAGNNQKTIEYYNYYSALDKKIKSEQVDKIKGESAQEVNKANAEKAAIGTELSKKSMELEETLFSLKMAEEIQKRQELEIELSEFKNKELNRELNQRRMIIFSLLGIMILVLIFIAILSMQFKKIKTQNNLLAIQNEKINRQNIQIKDSILYAQRIQEAILPMIDYDNAVFQPFVFFKPKDVVSGDFYWHASIVENGEESFFFAAVDCTGHGVPGAFMSMIGSSILSEIVNVRRIVSPGKILSQLSKEIRQSLKQDQRQNHDGMDACLVKITKKGNQLSLVFAGAKRPLFYLNANSQEVEIIPGDRHSIGGENNTFEAFTEQSAILNAGDILYLSSDGIIDQNGPDRKRFGTTRLISFIKENQNQKMSVQKEMLAKEIESYMSGEEQRDDIMLIGLKIT